ncbi:MAG: hypothetical protein LW860_14065 [Xanthomonadaceae bacterium]|jgi:hypothetical protein|nr:hypothetical protein [Xanthomonadaceae bacterium]
MRLSPLLLCGFLTALPAQAAIFTVTSTADSGPGSLRQAILDSNANGNSELDTISFNIPGAGPHVIAPTTALPGIRSSVTIDGYTQPGATPNTRTPAQGGLDTQLRIVVSGQNGLSGSVGLVFENQTASGTRTLRGLAIAGFETQVRWDANLPGDLIIEGNFIGTDAGGVAPPAAGLAGRSGIFVFGSLGNMRIGGPTPAQRNLIAGPGGTTGNSGVGIDVSQLLGGSVTIQGNLIGTDPSGTSARAHAIGVRVTGVSPTLSPPPPPPGTAVQIGGTDVNARNLISGNLVNGIALGNFGSFLVDRVVVEGNWIGTDASGLLPLPNGTSVTSQSPAGIVRLQNFPGSSRARIGGSAPGAANRIAFNIGPGILLSCNGNSGDGGTVEMGDNQIFGNSGIPVDNTDRPRANDPGDPDVGTNRVQNFPELFAATRPAPGVIDVGFRVDTAVANATYPLRVDFYSADPAGGPLVRIGTASIAAADAQTNRTVSLNSSVGVGFITAIATDANGNSSEYSDVLDVNRIFDDGFESP